MLAILAICLTHFEIYFNLKIIYQVSISGSTGFVFYDHFTKIRFCIEKCQFLDTLLHSLCHKMIIKHGRNKNEPILES